MIYTCKPARVEIYVNTGRKTTAQIKAETGCTALINGGLFNMSDFTPVCHLKVDGRVLAKDQYKYWGFGWNDADLELTQDYSGYKNYISCVCMVKDGQAEKMHYSSDLGGYRPRTAIGVFEDGRVWLYADATNTKTPEQLQKYAISQGVKHAIMLDGGGSTQGAAPGTTVNASRTVHNYICVWTDDKIVKDDEKMKIYLSPSAQPANTYATGNTNEQVQCNRIAEAAKTALERCGFEVKKAPEGQSYKKNVEESNAWGADLHIPIHTNAGGGYGAVVFVYSRTKSRLAYATPVYDALCKIVPKANTYGVRENAGLYEVSQSKASCIYLECEFHDNAELAKWIIDHVEEIGEAICEGVCKGAGVTYVAKKETSAIYRVQTGAFSKKENAEKLAAELKTKGYDTYIVGG